MDRFQQFLNDGWRPEQAPMKGLPKVDTIASAAALKVLRAKPIYTSPTWRPGDTTRCVCPVCDPDEPTHVKSTDCATPATKRRRLTRAQRDALNQARQRQEAPSRAEFAAWMRGVVGERSKP